MRLNESEPNFLIGSYIVGRLMALAGLAALFGASPPIGIGLILLGGFLAIRMKFWLTVFIAK